jgi:hypothetical protein
MSDTLPRFCVNCKWHELETRVSPPSALCGKAREMESVRYDLVTGQNLGKRWRSCKETRDYANLCGPEGRWFEPKEATP